MSNLVTAILKNIITETRKVRTSQSQVILSSVIIAMLLSGCGSSSAESSPTESSPTEFAITSDSYEYEISAIGSTKHEIASGFHVQDTLTVIYKINDEVIFDNKQATLFSYSDTGESEYAHTVIYRIDDEGAKGAVVFKVTKEEVLSNESIISTENIDFHQVEAFTLDETTLTLETENDETVIFPNQINVKLAENQVNEVINKIATVIAEDQGTDIAVSRESFLDSIGEIGNTYNATVGDQTISITIDESENITIRIQSASVASYFDASWDSENTTMLLSPKANVEWNIMVYIVGDGDLEYFMYSDLEEMYELMNSGRNLDNLVINVMADGHPEYDNTGFTGSNGTGWDTTRTYTFIDGSVEKNNGENELNMGDPVTLSSFVNASIQNHPANHYALILWDHGDGYSIGPDETNGYDVITIQEVNSAVTSALAEVGVNKLDIIGYDACLMATYDAAMWAKDIAHYFVASQELEPGSGWDYDSLFPEDVDVSNLSAELLGRSIIDSFINSVDRQGTLSLVDLEKLETFQIALQKFVDNLPDEQNIATEITRAMSETVKFNENPRDESVYYDLGIFLNKLSLQSEDLLEQRSNLITLLQESVTYKHQTDEAYYQDISGLTIYFSEGKERISDYAAGIDGVAEWSELLNLSLEQNIPDGSAASIEEIYVSIESNSYEIELEVDAANWDYISDVEIYYGIENQSSEVYSMTYYGESLLDMPFTEFTQSSDSFTIEAKIPILQITDQHEKSSIGYANFFMWPTSDEIYEYFISIPAVYFTEEVLSIAEFDRNKHGEDIDLEVHCTDVDDNGELQNCFYEFYPYTEDTTKIPEPFTPSDNSKIAFLLEEFADNHETDESDFYWVYENGSKDSWLHAADTLSFSLKAPQDALPEEDILVEVWLTDSAGNYDFQEYEIFGS